MYSCGHGVRVKSGQYVITHPKWPGVQLTGQVGAWCARGLFDVGDSRPREICAAAFLAEIVCDGKCVPTPASNHCLLVDKRCVDASVVESLVVVASVRYVVPIGWGSVWSVRVQQVEAGRLVDQKLSLRIAVGKHFGGFFAVGGAPPPRLRLVFRRATTKSSVFSGFTAKAGDRWELVQARPVSKPLKP